MGDFDFIPRDYSQPDDNDILGENNLDNPYRASPDTQDDGFLSNLIQGAKNEYNYNFKPIVDLLSAPKQLIDLGLGSLSGHLTHTPNGGVSAPSVGEELTSPGALDYLRALPFPGAGAADLAQKSPLVKNALQGTSDIVTDPMMALLPESKALGASFLPGMVSNLSGRAGKVYSLLADQGKSFFDPEIQSELGAAIPEAGLTAMGLHGLSGGLEGVSRAVPDAKVPFSGYSLQSPIELDTPWMREPYRAGDENPITGRSLDPSAGYASAITQNLYHGTGDRTWAEEGQPFSSRKASSENLYGGPFYFTKEPAIAEGQYAAAGEGMGDKPGLINADVTTNKTFDLDAPVPNDVKVRGLAEIQKLKGEASQQSLQSGIYDRWYQELKDAKTGREAQEILGNALDWTRPSISNEPEGTKPLFDRSDLSPQDRFNKLISEDLGYDSLTHKSHLGHDVTIPFSRHQIDVRDVQPLNPIKERSAQGLLDEYHTLNPDNPAHRPLMDAIINELDQRHQDISSIPEQTILKDPELGPKYIKDLENLIRLRKGGDAEFTIPRLEQQLKTANRYLNEGDLLKQFHEGTYESPVTRENFGKLTPEEEALVNPPKGDDSELIAALLQGIKGKGVPGDLRYAKALENIPELEGEGPEHTHGTPASSEQVGRINEVLKQILSEEGLNHPVDVQDLPSLETRTPKPIELGQAVSNIADKLGIRDIIAPGLNTVSKIAEGWGPYPKEIGKEISKSEAPPSAIGPTNKPKTERLGNPSLSEKQQELFDRLQRENPEDPTIQRVREAMTKRISERVGGDLEVRDTLPLRTDKALLDKVRELREKGMSLPEALAKAKTYASTQIIDLPKESVKSLGSERARNEAVQTKPLGPGEGKGSVVATEGEGKKVPHQIFLNDGSVHTVRAATPEEAQQIAEDALAEKGSDKQVVKVQEKQGSLETAASIPTSQRDIKQIDKITKAQDLETIQGRNNIQRIQEAAQTKELKQQLATEEAYKKAQEQAAKRKAREAEKAKAKAAAEEKKATISTKVKNSDSPIARLVDEITSIPTTLKTLGHFSYPMRQGFFSITRPEALSGIKEGFKSFFSKDVHDRILKDLESRPNAENYKKFGLQQVSYEDAVANRAEEFPGKTVQKYIPLAERSSRGFQDTGNLVRANEWDMWDKVFKSAGKNPDTHPQDYKYMTDYLNDKTRRPELPDVLKGAGYLANKLMFTPRGYLAKWNLMKRIGTLGYGAPKEMKLGILRDLHGSLAIAGAITASVYQAAKAAGEDVETSLDPRNKLFGRVKVGHTTYDLFAGLNPIITDSARMITGKAVSHKGNVYENLPTGESVRSSTLKSHFANQASPFVGAVMNAIAGRNNIGQPETFTRFLQDIGEPMMTANIRKGYENWGLSEALKNLPGAIGTHTEVDLTPEEEKERKESQPIIIPRNRTSKGKTSGHKSKFKF